METTSLATTFAAGVLTIATPCVLPMVPVYLAALAGGDIRGLAPAQRGQLVIRTLLFAGGFTAVFTMLGLAATNVGGFLGDHRAAARTIGSVFIVLFALKFLHIIEIPWLDNVVAPSGGGAKTKSASINAVLMGALFAVGWSPCVGPVLGSVLTYTASSGASAARGGLYLSVYGAGMAVPLILASAFAENLSGWLKKVRPWLPRVERVTGLGLLGVGVAMLLAADAPRSVAAGQTQLPSSCIADAARPTMLELYSEDCPVCQAMKPVVAKIAEDCEGDTLELRTIDVGASGNRGLVEQFRLVGVPTFLFLDDQGREVARLIGQQSEQSLRQALSALRGQSCEGVGALPPAITGEAATRTPAFVSTQQPEPKREDDTPCPSTTTTAMPARATSKSTSAWQSATSQWNAPSAATPPAACSLWSP